MDGETAGPPFEGAVEEFKRDDALDALILTGSRLDAFCSGADLKNVGSLGAERGAGLCLMGISRITDVGQADDRGGRGSVPRGRVELARRCDFRVVSESAQFGALTVRWGVPLVDGGTQRVRPRIVGLGNALYLIETGARR